MVTVYSQIGNVVITKFIRTKDPVNKVPHVNEFRKINITSIIRGRGKGGMESKLTENP